MASCKRIEIDQPQAVKSVNKIIDDKKKEAASKAII